MLKLEDLPSANDLDVDMKSRAIYPYGFRFLAFALVVLLSGCSGARLPATLPPDPVPATNTQPPTETASSPDATPAAMETALPYDQLVALFNYDNSALPAVKENGVQSKNGVQVHDINITDKNGSAQQAFLVTPTGKGPYAAIEFLSRSGGDRSQFLDEAISYAKMGVVSLLLGNSFHPTNTSAEKDRQQLIQTIIDLRRGLDLLLSQPGVDPTRLAFVGHSAGADFGAVLAGVDKRPFAYVLMSGTGLRSKDLEGSIPDPTEQAAYMKAVSQLDGINFIGHAAPAALFFQNATLDPFVSESDALRFQHAGSEPKTIKMYVAGHELNGEASQERSAWLQKQLRLSSQE